MKQVISLCYGQPGKERLMIMTLEQLQKYWENFRERYQKEFGQELMSLEEMLSVYAYHRNTQRSDYAMTSLINEITHGSEQAFKLRGYFRKDAGLTGAKLNNEIVPVLSDWFISKNSKEKDEYAKAGEKLYNNYKKIQKESLKAENENFRQKIDLHELEKKAPAKEQKEEAPAAEQKEEAPAVEQKEEVPAAEQKEEAPAAEQKEEAPTAEQKEEVPVADQKEELNTEKAPQKQQEIDPSRQSILDAFDAIRDTTVSRFGTKHDKEFDAVWDAVNEYEAAVYEASLNKKDIDRKIGSNLFSACKNYLMLHLREKKGVQSIDGQGSKDGRLRKQAIVNMLEVMMNNDDLNEFAWASQNHAANLPDNKKNVSLDFGQLKRSLAESSRVRSVPIEQRYYAELEEKKAEIRLQKQKEAADFSEMSRNERKKQRQKNSGNEYFRKYGAFLNKYPLPQRAEMAKRINSNEISELNEMKREFGKDNEKLKKYLEHRIQNLQIINRTVDRAEKNLKNRKIEEPTITKRTDGSISGIMMKNVEQPMMQKTFNGCWSVALSSLLKYRGVDMDQTTIRAYRPMKNIADANYDRSNNITNYVDLVQKVMPNAAVNEVEVYQQNFDGVKWTDEARTAEKEVAKQKLKTTLLSAMDSEKGPVAFLCGHHYRTVLGLEEREIDGVKTDCVTLYDPMRAEKVTLTLDQLTEQSYMKGKMEVGSDAKGNPVNNWMGEGFSFTMQWLKDLTDSKGNMLPDQKLESQGVSYDQNGNLKANKNAINKNASTSAYKAVSWSLNEDIEVRTYLPAKMTVLQKKVEKEKIQNFLGDVPKKINHSNAESGIKRKMTYDGPKPIKIK